MAILATTEALPELISADQVGKLCHGKPAQWVLWKLKFDKGFPRPVADAPSSNRGVRRLWLRVEIEAWQQQEDELRAAKKNASSGDFAGAMAVHFIRGRYDPPPKQLDRVRRIERSRRKEIKRQPPIRTEGDWS